MMFGTADFSVVPHPRLLLPEGGEERIVALLEEDEALRNVHEAILTQCDGFLYQPPLQYVKEGKRLLHVSREALKRIYWLAYSYRTTGKDAYADRAVQEMLQVCSFPDWNPSHFLDVAEMVTALAIGYDWLYGCMTPCERELVSDAIVEKGFKPSEYDEYSGFYNLENNWNQVCSTGMLYGALATYENHHEMARDLIDLSVKTIPRALKCYAPDGGYPEGFNYWCYGTSFQILMIAALQTALGTDFGLSQSPGLLESSAFIQFMTAPGMECFNFSDSYSHVPCNVMMYWCAGMLDDPSRIYLERKNLENLPSDFMDNPERYFAEHRLLPSLMVFNAMFDLSEVSVPEERFWSCGGRTPLFIYRGGWENGDDAYLGIKGGSAMTSHAHMDAGSFVYEYGGVRWSADLGAQDYYPLESKGIDLWNQSQDGQRWNVFRLGNESHSTLTLNGNRHRARAFAPIVEKWQSRAVKGARMDLTSVFEGDADSVVRSIWLDRKDHLHVRDEILSGNRPVEVKWIMNTPAQARILSANRILLVSGGRKMILEISSDIPVRAAIWPNDPPNDYDAANPGTRRVGFLANVPDSSSAVFSVALYPDR